jgi:hypothetical protein
MGFLNTRGIFMTIVRIKHQKNYVVINKLALEDKNLSFKAKGLWAYCMSRPDDWTFHVSHLITVSNDGEKAVYSALRELEENGYLKRVQFRDRGKFTRFDYEISEIKIILPQPQKGDAVKRRVEKEGLLSIDIELSKDSTSPDTSYSKEEEEFFSQRMKELPKPPKHISAAYKAKVIKGFKDSPPILSPEQKRDRNLSVNLPRARTIATEALKSPNKWLGDISLNRDGILHCKSFGGVFAPISPVLDPDEWEKEVGKWRKK